MNGFEYFRRRMDLTQMEVAAVMGIDQTTVSRWEKGKKLPRSGKLPRLSLLYHCTIEDLFGDYDDLGQ